MRLRRAGTLVLALALVACTKVTQGEQPASLVFATYDSATSTIPLPNDLALQGAAAVTPLAQREVLQGFIKSGGFPSDQEVAITIPLRQENWEVNAAFPNGHYVPGAAPTVDCDTVGASTVTVVRTDVSPPAAVAYDKVCTAGLLKLRPVAVGAARHWAGGRYAVAVRGGANGVKTTGGANVEADLATTLAVQNLDLNIPANRPPGMTDAQAAQAEALRESLWSPIDWQATSSGAWAPIPTLSVTPAMSAVDLAFPHGEAAVVATFGIDKSAHVALDPGAGQVPLPSDFLLDFTPANCPTGVAPCVSATASAAFGPAGPGLRTLDGFSTTALLLAPLTGAVDAGTLTYDNVHLFELSTAGAAAHPPVRLKDVVASLPTGAGAAYLTQPPQFSAAVGGKTLATTLVLAPAVGVPVSATATLPLPPLKEQTTYAVVVTKRVLNADGSAMTRGTVGNIVLGTTGPLWGTAGGAEVPFISGPDLATAKSLQGLRDQLAPFLAALPVLTGGKTAKDDVAMVYTIHTQSVTGTSLQLSAAPLSIEVVGARAVFAATAAPTPVTPPAGVPTTGVAGFFSVPFLSVDGIDKSTGTFRATLKSDLGDPAVLPTLLAPLSALVAVPNAANVPFCAGSTTVRCAKVVVFGHGLNGDKTNLYGVASSLAQAGFVAAAIDFPLHGDRNWCASDAHCGAGGTCVKTGAFAASAGQGDCGSLDPASAQCAALRPGVCTGALPVTAGSRFFVGGNFFRIRDAFRQNLFDQAALMLVLARPPALPSGPYPQPSPANAFTALLGAVAPGVVVDPSSVHYEGLSLGSIAGASVMATNARVGRGVLSVGGGTFVDIAATSPSFTPLLDAVFGTVIPGYSRAKITPGDPAFDPAVAAQYIQLLQVAKWIIDPADPINYAGHVRTSPLPNLLANPDGSVAQAAKEVFAQIALGDTVVPNPTNLELDLLLAGPFTTYDVAGGPAPHSMLVQSAAVMTDAAAFLVDPAVFPAATKTVTIP